MKKDSNISLRLSSKIKDIMLRHKISPQQLFDEEIIEKLKELNLNDIEKESVNQEILRLKRKRSK